MQTRSRKWLQFQGVVVGAALAGMGCTQAAITAGSEPRALPTDAASTTRAAFGSTTTLVTGHSVTFTDGLTVVLDQVNDSRCPPIVSCVWSGELAPQLTLHGGGVGAPQTIKLGTVANKKLDVAGYEFALIKATTDSATFAVTKLAR
jgi:hypothetical protein